MERCMKLAYVNCHFCLGRVTKRTLIKSSCTSVKGENNDNPQHSSMRSPSGPPARFISDDDREFLDFARGNHKGRMQVPAVALPPAIVDSVNDMLYAEKGLFKVIKREAAKLDAHLRSRNPPYLNPSETKFDKRKWTSNMIQKLDDMGDQISPEQRELFSDEIEAEAERRRKELKNLSGFWRSIAYDSPKACLAYTLCRAAPNYAVSIRVLNEIVRRDPEFSPESVLDFGSGTGSFVWSLLTVWPRRTNFFYLNDVSNEFNNLSCSLLAGDDVDFNPTSNGIYYKLHLPADVRPNFDLTFSGYTLSELNGPGSRIAAVKHLLKCTKKYLVFVENGTLRSHHLLEELREYVTTHFSREFQIFAPCPHSKPCPLLMTNLKQQRKSLICRTAVTYFPFPIRNHVKKNATTELFTYLILRRRENNQTNFKSEVEESAIEDFTSREIKRTKEEDFSWPRVVQQPRRRSGHVVLRLCCSDGTACESIVSKEQRKSLICRTAVTYFPFPIRNHVKKNATTELFTYLILRRRENNQTNFKSEVEESAIEDFTSREIKRTKEEDFSWPRVVQQPRRRSGHVVLRLCCSDGTACESIVSKGKHPSFFYKSCKFAQSGDRLPLPNLGTEELHSELSDVTSYFGDGSVTIDDGTE